MVNSLPLWRLVGRVAGPGGATIAPVLAACAALGILVALTLRRRDRRVRRIALIGAAVVVAVLGLLMTDPQFPAKRIHVGEYVLVAWLIWRGLAGRLDGWGRAAFAALIASLMGVHDEMIQGLHPERSFGLWDMAANACGAVAGALAAMGAGPMDGRRARVRGIGHAAIFASLLIVTAPLYLALAQATGWTFR